RHFCLRHRKGEGSEMSLKSVLILMSACVLACIAQNKSPDKRACLDFAMQNDGDASRGKKLFADENRLACSRCHTVDGTASKAGPDLAFVGDKFPRRELIRSVLEPSAAIAVGYGTTIVETKS